MTRFNQEEVLNYEVIYVMYDGIFKTINPSTDFKKGKVQFKDLLSEVNYHGGVIKVWADNAESGDLFEYGGYEGCFWYTVGHTRGYK